MNRTLIARAAGTAFAVAAVTAASACAPTPAHPAAAPQRTPVSVPTTPAPADPSPTPGPTTPAATPPTPVPVLVPGTYVHVTGAQMDALYLLAPGATTWQHFADVPMPPVPAGQFVVAWAVDGGHVLITHKSDGSMWGALADGSDQHLIVKPPMGSEVCGESFDARADRVLYGVATIKGDHVTLYTAKADGTDRRTVPGADTMQACWAAWSADGSTLVFNRSYVKNLPIREYHEILVSDGTKTREVLLKLPNNVHADLVAAVSADGRTAVVAAMKVRPDGSCGDADNLWYLADLRTGAVTALVPPAGAQLSDGGVIFDGSGRMLMDTQSEVKVKKAYHEVYKLIVFDQHGKVVASLTRPAGIANDANVRVWTAIA